MTMMQHAELTEKIIRCAYNVHNQLGSGFLESVYERAFLVELKVGGLQAEAQKPLDVIYRGEVVGSFFADVIVSDLVIVELKAAEAVNKAHEAQLVNYLTATGKDIGLLINFGPSGVEVRRKVRDLSKLPPR